MAGVVRTEATGCKDETAARQMLADLERRAELVCSGVMSAAEAIIGDHQGEAVAESRRRLPLAPRSVRVSAKHLYEIRRQPEPARRRLRFRPAGMEWSIALSRQQWIRTPAARANGSAGITFGCRPREVSFPIVYEHRLFYQSVLADFDAAPVEQWLVQPHFGEDMSASTRNSYLAAAGALRQLVHCGRSACRQPVRSRRQGE